MGVGDGNLTLGVKVCHFIVRGESHPAVTGKEIVDLLQRGRDTFDCWLLDHESQPRSIIQSPEKPHVVSEQLIVKMPTLQIRYGRRSFILIGPVQHQKPEKVRPCDF